MTADRIRSAIDAATGHYAAHPEEARATDSEATATLVDGVDHCPVCNALERPIPITVEVATY